MRDASPTARELRALQSQLLPALQALVPGLQLQVADSVASTNTALLDGARSTPAGQPCTPRLLVAVEQTAGRGRLGRSWHAAPGSSLTFSLALPMAPRTWDGLSLAVGLALADALDPPGAGPNDAPRIGLKWPNDLWLWDGPGAGRKLGGILIETVLAGRQRVCVVGVGLNIAPQAVQATGVAAASLQALEPGLTPARTLQRCAPALLQALLCFEHDGFAPLAAVYQRRDLLRGQPVHTLQAGDVALQGVAVGVDSEGALCICTGGDEGNDAAAVQHVRSGEVSVRLQHPAAARATPC
jgi:BirA family biotin operon repressor/biotin-[acetyl-CoA-carboxylase] ligase